jgi:DNA-binding MarR family transcriptional regulator
LERVLSVIARREERWRAYEELAARAQVDLPPTQLWALCRLAEHAPASPQAIAAATGVDEAQLEQALAGLGRGGLVTRVNGEYDLAPDGQRVFDVIVRVKRATLEELVRDWSPEDHAQLEPMLDRLARSLASEMPTPA